jgi:5-formyltetrahydrofolate cyclo-ligase
MRPQKRERRAYYRKLQESFPAQLFAQWNQGLAPRLREVAAELPRGSLVAVYQARAKEASLKPLFDLPFRFAFPLVLDAEKGEMEFRLVEKAADESEFHIGPFGILEPTKKHPLVDRAEIQACFIPLLAFDLNGRRLGRGKGFYDRFLDGFAGLKLGVGFEWQFSPEELPVEKHDQRLDLAITEQLIRDFQAASPGRPQKR